MPRGKPASGTRRQRRPAMFDGIPVPDSIRGNGARGAWARGWRASADAHATGRFPGFNPYPGREPGEPHRFVHTCRAAWFAGYQAHRATLRAAA